MQNFDTENAFFFHNKTYINRIGEMVSFELGKEKKKMFLFCCKHGTCLCPMLATRQKTSFSKNFLCQARNEGTQRSDGGEVLPPETSSSESAAK